MRLNLAIFRNQILNYLILTNTGEKDWGNGAAGWLWIYQYQEQDATLNGTVALRYITEPLNLHLTARFSDDQNRLGEFEEPTHGYIVYDVGVQFLFSMWHLHHQTVLGIENILNTEYRQHLSRIKSVMPEPERNVKFLYRLNF